MERSEAEIAITPALGRRRDPKEVAPEDLAGHLLEEAGEDGHLYALLDLARGDEALEQLAGSGEDRYEVLGPGRGDASLFSVSPVLLPCPERSRVLAWLTGGAWGQSHGVLLSSPADLAELVDHLQPLTELEDERGCPLIFRFQDPRVLRVYLPTCTPWELRRFFGPVTRFWAEDRDGTGLLRFDLDAEVKVDAIEEEEEPSSGATLVMGHRRHLVIRDAQLAVFREREMGAFYRRMEPHLREQFPGPCGVLDDDELGQAMEHGVQRAAAHHLDTEQHVGLFLGLMLTFGPDFDSDPTHDWAARALDSDDRTADERMDALWAAAEARLAGGEA